MALCARPGCGKPSYNGQQGQFCCRGCSANSGCGAGCRARAVPAAVPASYGSAVTATCVRCGKGPTWNDQPGQHCCRGCQQGTGCGHGCRAVAVVPMCKGCGQWPTHNGQPNEFCTHECRRAFGQSAPMSQAVAASSTPMCKGCGRKPTWSGKPDDFCSKACREAFRPSQAPMCKGCGKKPTWNGKPNEFCTKECRAAFQQQATSHAAAASSGTAPQQGTFAFENPTAIERTWGSAQRDQFGNPLLCDLAKDMALKGFKVLIGTFVGQLADINSLSTPELKKKGFDVTVVDNEASFISELAKDYQVAWFISNGQISGDSAAFVEAVKSFHYKGGGLMIWGDNEPLFAHANAVLAPLFGFQLQGNTPGDKELVFGDPKIPGQLGPASSNPRDVGKLLCAGIERMNEGITICYPTRVPEGWSVFGTSSNGHPVLLAKEADPRTGHGRIVVDNGFTKLWQESWTTAGTPRYVSNCTVWLAWAERVFQR